MSTSAGLVKTVFLNLYAIKLLVSINLSTQFTIQLRLVELKVLPGVPIQSCQQISVKLSVSL